MSTTAVKTARTLQSSATNASGATTTGSGVDLTAALGMVVTGKITNGATGPSAGCQFILEISHDGSNWKRFSSQTAGTDNNGVYEFVVEVPAAAMHVRSRFTGNTGQSVTVEAFGHELTELSND